jgi:hypothetical protein
MEALFQLTSLGLDRGPNLPVSKKPVVFERRTTQFKIWTALEETDKNLRLRRSERRRDCSLGFLTQGIRGILSNTIAPRWLPDLHSVLTPRSPRSARPCRPRQSVGLKRSLA